MGPWFGKNSLQFYIPNGEEGRAKYERVPGGVCALFKRRVAETGALPSITVFKVYRGDDKATTFIDKVFTLKYIVTNEAAPTGPP